ncbi:MAG TPA: class I SAM-dependent methyltransferase [Planctomycetota bacterium]|nr:class I SAM-dependent methyltransferase [Planctomycetota bacterium]
MGLYYSYVFPWLLDLAMSAEVLTEQRRILIPTVHGSVLEVGFGTGRNVPFYPEDISELTVIEPNGRLSRKAEKRVRESGIQVKTLPLDAGAPLPLPESTYDAVVSTWTLCSIPNVEQALREIHPGPEARWKIPFRRTRSLARAFSGALAEPS